MHVYVHRIIYSSCIRYVCGYKHVKVMYHVHMHVCMYVLMMYARYDTIYTMYIYTHGK